MAGEPINIELVDKIPDSISRKLHEIASAATEADSAIARLHAQSSGLQSISQKLATAQAAQTTATRNAAAATQDLARGYQAAERFTKPLTTAQLRLASGFENAVNHRTRLTAAQIVGAARDVEAMKVSAGLSTAKEAEVLAYQRAEQFNNRLTTSQLKAAQGYENAVRVNYRLSEAQLKNAATALGVVKAKEPEIVAYQAAQRFINRLTTAQLAQIGVSIDQAIASGRLAAGEYEVATATARLNPIMTANTATKRANAVASHAAAVGNFALASSVREVLVLGREASMGNWSRFGGSVSLLAQYTGVLNKVFTPIGGLIAGATAAVGLFTFAALKGQQELYRLNAQLELSHHFAGLSVSGFKNLAHSIANELNTGASSAIAALGKIAFSGRVSGEAVENLTKASLLLARVTGEDADKIADDFLRMTNGVTAYALEFNRQYHVMDADFIGHLRQLEAQGRKTEAMEELSRRVWNGVRENAVENLGLVASAIRWVGITFDSVWTKIKNFGAQATLLEKQATLIAGIHSSETLLAIAQKTNNVAEVGVRQKLLAIQWQQFHAVTAQLGVEDQRTQQRSRQAIQEQKQIDAAETLINVYGRFNPVLNKQREISIANLKALIAAGSQSDPTIQLFTKNLAAIERNVQASMDRGSGATAAERAAERRATAMQVINERLDNQIARLRMLKPERDAQAEFDRIEEQMIGRRSALTATERQQIMALAVAREHAKEVSQQMDRLYDEVAGPMNAYKNTLEAIKQLTDAKAISDARANQMTIVATATYQAAIDPVAQLNKTLDALNVNYGEHLSQAQIVQAVTSELSKLYNENAGALREVGFKVAALDIAQAKGIITAHQYANEIRELGAQVLKMRLESGKGTFEDAMLSSAARITEGFKGTLSGLSDAFGEFFVTMETGFANTIGRVLTKQQTLKEGLQDLAVQGVSQLTAAIIKLGIQWLITQAIGETLAATATAATAAQATAAAVAWAPAAALASLATLGTNLAPASAALIAATTLAESLAAVSAAGFESGGYTGNIARDKVAGVVHGQEFVMNAFATRRYLPQLQAMNDNRSFNTYQNGGAPAQAPRITFINNGTPQNYQVDWTENDIRIIADDVAKQRVRNDTDGVIADKLADSNSRTSHSMGRHTTATRRRNG